MKRVVKMYFAANTIAIKVTRKVKVELGVRSRTLLHIAPTMPPRPCITRLYFTVTYGREWLHHFHGIEGNHPLTG